MNSQAISVDPIAEADKNNEYGHDLFVITPEMLAMIGGGEGMVSFG